jgi:hypothetical protein
MPSRTLTRVEFVGVYLADSNGSVGPLIKSPAHASIRPPLCKSKPATPVLGGFALSPTRQIQFQRALNLSLIKSSTRAQPQFGLQQCDNTQKRRRCYWMASGGHAGSASDVLAARSKPMKS